MHNTKTVYWAGGLFDHKELAGNILLAQHVEQASNRRYHIVLPQVSEANVTRSGSIRNSDFEILINCDLILANFDGCELDSGTVAEFCFAKALDMPAVLLRTDFRDSQDRSTCPDPWNLMCSDYPRTISLVLPAMAAQARFSREYPDMIEMLHAYYSDLAETIVKNLDQVAAMTPVIGSNFDDIQRHYRTMLQTIGGSLPAAFAGHLLDDLIKGKQKRGIFSL